MQVDQKTYDERQSLIGLVASDERVFFDLLTSLIIFNF